MRMRYVNLRRTLFVLTYGERGYLFLSTSSKGLWDELTTNHNKAAVRGWPVDIIAKIY